MATTTHHVKEVLKRTLATVASAKESRTTARSYGDAKRRRWLDSWLKIRSQHHPQLRKMELAVYDFCACYTKHPAWGWRMIVHGANGAGKSHAAKAVSRWAKRAAIDLPLVQEAHSGEAMLSDVQFLHWPTAVNAMKEGDYSFVPDLFNRCLVILDDIGAEHDPSRNGVEKLYLILERREAKWTFITSNYGPDQWAERFEQRIASRLMRNCNVVSVEDVPDYNSL